MIKINVIELSECSTMESTETEWDDSPNNTVETKVTRDWWVSGFSSIRLERLVAALHSSWQE